MKLSDLIHYRNNLVTSTNREYRWVLDNYIDLQLRNVRHDVSVRNEFERLVELSCGQVHSSLQQFESTLDTVIKGVNEIIARIEPDYFARSYNWYTQESSFETVEYILNRRLAVPDTELDGLKHCIKNLSDWRYPALCIRPGKENHTRWLVPCHPLYLVDTDHDLLKPALEQFNAKYQRHLRTFVVREQDAPMFNFIPDSQLGVIYAYYFFNFRPFEVIRQYLSELYHKLRPGGSLVFTYNNCDLSYGVKLSESSFCCYTPGGMLEGLAESIGYHHIKSENTPTGLFWMHLTKPGEITTLRGGQTLAKIVPKTLEQSK